MQATRRLLTLGTQLASILGVGGERASVGLVGVSRRNFSEQMANPSGASPAASVQQYKFSGMPSALFDYVLQHSVTPREHPVLTKLRVQTRSVFGGKAVMQIAPDQGLFMGLLVKLANAKKTIEVGVFTGYSTLVTALALPDDGKIVACDVSTEFTNLGRQHWDEAKVGHKVDLRIGPGEATLQQLIDNGEEGTYDMAFIDADKVNYDKYFELCLRLLRQGGLVAIDNTLWDGKVADMSEQDEDTVAIRNLNTKLSTDPRIQLAMLSVGDGLTLCYKL